MHPTLRTTFEFIELKHSILNLSLKFSTRKFLIYQILDLSKKSKNISYKCFEILFF